MLNISYTISPFLIRCLEKTERIRQIILLTPLPPRTEISLRFNAMVSRIENAQKNIQKPLTPEEIKTILLKHSSAEKQENDINSPLHQVVLYKQIFDILSQDWLVTQRSVAGIDLINLFSNVSKDKVKTHLSDIENVLEYLQTNSDNALIQAAIAKYQFTFLEPFSQDTDLFSTLASYLFLYKAGMDFRGLLVLEKCMTMRNDTTRIQYQNAIGRSHLTGWIEYFVQSVSDQLEEILESLKEPFQLKNERQLELNDRQKRILHLLDDPAQVITNRQVQKIFHISQITASRDLAKLTGLGLLFPHGKGRSVRYARI